MNSGIALLLSGSSTDLPATLQAIELAKRTTGVVHAIFVEDGKCAGRTNPGEEAEHKRPTGTEQLISLVSRLGDAKGITIHMHVLENSADDLLIRFFCEYRIFCLITGAGNQDSAKRHTAWVERLRIRLSGERDCFLPPLWSVIIQPWNDTVFEQIISGVTGAAGRTPAMKMMCGNLRNGLYKFKESMKQKKV